MLQVLAVLLGQPVLEEAPEGVAAVVVFDSSAAAAVEVVLVRALLRGGDERVDAVGFLQKQKKIKSCKKETLLNWKTLFLFTSSNRTPDTEATRERETRQRRSRRL